MTRLELTLKTFQDLHAKTLKSGITLNLYTLQSDIEMGIDQLIEAMKEVEAMQANPPVDKDRALVWLEALKAAMLSPKNLALDGMSQPTYEKVADAILKHYDLRFGKKNV